MALDKNVPLAANQIAADIVAINANWEELMKSSHIYAADAEASDTYVVTLAPAPTAYANGMILNIKVNTANTGACTLNVNALGAIAIKKYHDQDPETGDIEANQILTVVYNSTGPKFQIVSQLASFTGSGAPVRATSPTLVTPALGTPSAGVLTNCTGLPAAGVVGTAAIVANTLKGDGTAGRVLRCLMLKIDNGTTGISLKVETASNWNGDINALVDNLDDAETISPFSLADGGISLRILDAGITGTVIGVLAASLIVNNTALDIYPSVEISATAIRIQVHAGHTGVGADMRTLVDTGAIWISILYVTNA